MKKLVIYLSLLLVILTGCMSVQSDYKLSGKVLYNTINLPLADVTISAYSSPSSTVALYSTVTDINGNYELTLPEGNYYLRLTSSKPWNGADNNDIYNLQLFVAHLTPNTITGDPLKATAADMDQDGLVQSNDVTILQRKKDNLIPNPNYKISDWVFQTPNVVIMADRTLNIFGMCSGDFNSSYVQVK